jgi:hypothetical protein
VRKRSWRAGSCAKGGLSKTHRDYWIQRIFKPTYSRHGATVEGRNLCVEIQHYARAFRKIIADMIGLDDNPKKFDYRTGGYQEWRGKVEGVKLAWITRNVSRSGKERFWPRRRSIH